MFTYFSLPNCIDEFKSVMKVTRHSTNGWGGVIEIIVFALVWDNYCSINTNSGVNDEGHVCSDDVLR